jgi:hypothetical protein
MLKRPQHRFLAPEKQVLRVFKGQELSPQEPHLPYLKVFRTDYPALGSHAD